MVGCRIAYKLNALFPKLSHILPGTKQIQETSHFEKSTLLFNQRQQELAHWKRWELVILKEKTWCCENQGPSSFRCEAWVLESLFIPSSHTTSGCQATLWSQDCGVPHRREGFRALGQNPSSVVKGKCYNAELTAQALASGSWQKPNWFEPWVPGLLTGVLCL